MLKWALKALNPKMKIKLSFTHSADVIQKRAYSIRTTDVGKENYDLEWTIPLRL